MHCDTWALMYDIWQQRTCTGPILQSNQYGHTKCPFNDKADGLVEQAAAVHPLPLGPCALRRPRELFLGDLHCWTKRELNKCGPWLHHLFCFSLVPRLLSPQRSLLSNQNGSQGASRFRSESAGSVSVHGLLRIQGVRGFLGQCGPQQVSIVFVVYSGPIRSG